MGVDHKILRGSEDFKGLDKRTSDIMRSREYATDMKNAAYRVSGAINKRKGYHSHVLDTQGSYGMITYKNVNTSTGAITDEVLKVDSDLSKLTEVNLDLDYAGAESIWYSVILDSDTGTFKFKVTLDTSGEIANIELGTGLGHADDKTLAQLKTSVDAITDLTLTVPGTVPSKPAALLDIVLSEPLLSGGATNNITYRYWATIAKGDTGLANDFNGYLRATGNLDDTELNNATFAQLNNVLYIANGYDDLMKYDGTRIYKAGLPQPVSCAGAGDGTGTGTPDGTYYYKIVYEYTDAKGNIITSVAKDSAAVTVSTEDVNVTYPNLQSGGRDLASSDLKIKIYRNKASAGTGGLFYLLTTIANNTGAATSIYLDNNADSSLSAFATFPTVIKRQDPPPKGKFITTFRDCLVITGQPTNVNNIQYSLPKNAATGEIGSEYFPDDDNGAIVDSSFGDKITAIAPLRDALYIFHKSSIHILTGDIAEPEGIPYRIDLLTTEGGIGCEAHHTIQELRGELLFLSNNGIYGINTSNNLREVSKLIKPLFATIDVTRARTNLKKRRATAFNWVSENVYIVHVPTESADDGAGTANLATCTTSDSIIAVYDYTKDAWLQWDALDFSGGVTLFNEKIYFNDRSLDTSNDIRAVLSSMSVTDTTYDYSDHASAITFEYDTNWESLQEPTVPKKYLRLKVYAMDTDGTFETPGFSLNATLQKDYNFADLGTISMDFGSSSGGGWGIIPWGTSTWGSASHRFIKSKLPTGKSRSLKVRYANNTINENVLITNYELEIAAPFRVEIKE